MAGNNNDAGCDMWNKESTMQFQLEPNMLYAVYVKGHRTTGGLFELDISCEWPTLRPTLRPTLQATAQPTAQPTARPILLSTLQCLPTPSGSIYFQGPQEIVQSE